MIGDLDLILIVFAYVALLFLPFAWGWALWMAHQENVDYNILMFGAHLPGPFLVGLAIYVVGMICTELKEVV